MSNLDDSIKGLNNYIKGLEENQKLLDRIQACIDDSGGLNDWEDNFLDDIKKRVSENKELSDRTIDKLEQIEDVVANGRSFEYYNDY